MALIDLQGREVDPYAPLGFCSQCGAAAWTTTRAGLLCPDHANVLEEVSKCERCGNSYAEHHSLQVELDGQNVQLAQFRLCGDCYGYGELISPIARVSAFLNPSHMIITDDEYQPTLYYVMDCRTFEYIGDGIRQVWRTNDLEVAQDKLAELTGV